MDRLHPKTTVLLVVDIQEKLAAAMPPETFAAVVKNPSILIETAKTLGVPVLATVQYVKGLGATVSPLAALLPAAPLEKMTFDACSDLQVARSLADLAPRSVIVAGMESHVCVFQTARELVKRGFNTHVIADAVCSRREENRQLGLGLCERAGAYLTPTETAAFDLLGTSGTAEFKAISKLIR
jgi:nicotinamidase-related amidase